MNANEIAFLIIGLIAVGGVAGILIHAAWRADHPKTTNPRVQ